MAHLIGSIQGRLLPPLDGRIQSFPRGRWEEEFSLLAAAGYRAIELTIETASWDIHPLLVDAGRKRLRALSDGTGIALHGICCDVFMECPLMSPEESVRAKAEGWLRQLLEASSRLGMPFIELPFVGVNAIRGEGHVEVLARTFDWALPLAESLGVDILLETDLGPEPLAAMLNRFSHSSLGLNYDTGNSTWFGFDPVQELETYHSFIRNIHIKDCTRKDYSVPLGKGETRFDLIFPLLRRFGYRGHFIMQAARQPDDLAAGREYREFTERLVGAYLQGDRAS